MLQFAKRFGFDLADALAGDTELLADFFERVVGVHADAETHAQHALFARCQRSENTGRGLLAGSPEWRSPEAERRSCLR